MHIYPFVRSISAIIVLTISSFAHAGIAFQSYVPGQSPVDYGATAVNFDKTFFAAEGGGFYATTGAWFTFQMPHAASLTGITLPADFISAPANNTLNFGFWLGNGPTGSNVGGVSLPVADIVIGQTKDYSFNFAPGYLFGAGQTVTIQVDVIGGNGSAQIDGFLSNTDGTTHETSLGVIFDPTPLNKYLAIQIRDNFVEAPEPGSAMLLLIGATAAMAARRRRV